MQIMKNYILYLAFSIAPHFLYPLLPSPIAFTTSIKKNHKK